MCSFAQAAVAALQVGTTLVAAKAQNKQADYQTEAIQRNYDLQTAQTYQEYQQRQQQTMEQMSQRTKEAWVEEGRLQAALGESGLQSGGTDVRSMNAVQNDASYDISTLENNRVKAEEQVHMEALGNQARAQSQYNAIQRPTALGVGLQIAGSIAKVKMIGDDAVAEAWKRNRLPPLELPKGGK